MSRKNINSILNVRFDPRSGYPLPIEICLFSEVKRRANRNHLGALQRLDFYMLLGIKNGTCVHTLDFTPHTCRQGDWLVVTPDQVQQFDLDVDWNAWMVMFRPEALLPKKAKMATTGMSYCVDPGKLAERSSLTADEHATCMALANQMARDAQQGLSNEETYALLQFQLHTLLLRLAHSQHQFSTEPAVSSVNLERVERFKQAVELDFKAIHQIKTYALKLGYTEKTLTRATYDIVGMSAKHYLSNRITLEAKRMLAHTSDQIALIGGELGFDESTNFVKFFKRQTGMTPRTFREQYRGFN